MNRKFFKLLTFFTVFSVILILANVSYAQRRRTRTISYSKGQVEQLLRRIEEKTDRFTKVFDEALDDSRLDGSRAEENYTDLARYLENETDELRREFNRSDSYLENTPNVRSVLDAATAVDRVMKSRNFGRASESLWLGLRTDFNTLAGIYRVPAVGSSSYRGVLTRNAGYLESNTRGRVFTKEQIEDLIEKIEEGADAFTKEFDEVLDDSRLNRTRTEEEFTDLARYLENETDELRREFDHNDRNGKTRINAGKVLRAATFVDDVMKSRNFGNQIEAKWVGLRADINLLAGIYKIPTVGSRNYQ